MLLSASISFVRKGFIRISQKKTSNEKKQSNNYPNKSGVKQSKLCFEMFNNDERIRNIIKI